jgi:hypothetical protein
MINHYNSNNLANEKEELKVVPISVQLRGIGVNEISITRDCFSIAFNDGFDVFVNKYNDYDDIYEKTKSQLLGNTFVSSDIINKVLEFLESNHKIITNKIKGCGGGFS